MDFGGPVKCSALREWRSGQQAQGLVARRCGPPDPSALRQTGSLPGVHVGTSAEGSFGGWAGWHMPLCVGLHIETGCLIDRHCGNIQFPCSQPQTALVWGRPLVSCKKPPPPEGGVQGLGPMASGEGVSLFQSVWLLCANSLRHTADPVAPAWHGRVRQSTAAVSLLVAYPQIIFTLHSLVTQGYLWSCRPLASQFSSCALCCTSHVPN